jgi:pSer/pThr/pTyr-binding forkhead associated (FHA) protein
MSFRVNGELVPTGGGDNIPLIRESLTIGRRDACDICLRFHNISGLHAELNFRSGYWYIRDCNSTNGLKVNGVRVMEKMLHPGEKITIGKRDYIIRYDLPADHIGALEEAEEEDIMSQPLLEKAGLQKPPREERRGFDPGRFLLEDDE